MKKVRHISFLILLLSVLILLFGYLFGDRLHDLKIYASILLAGILGFLLYIFIAHLAKNEKISVIVGIASALIASLIVFFRWDVFIDRNQVVIQKILFFLPVVLITLSSLVLYFVKKRT